MLTCTLADFESDASGNTNTDSEAWWVATGVFRVDGAAGAGGGGGEGARGGGGAADRSYSGGRPRLRLTAMGCASSFLRLLLLET